MQCPLCREKVTNEDQLQVHYLMSCSGYVEDLSVNKTKQGSGSRNLTTRVQFRWSKTKPTLAREVFLISSLAGSTALKWNEVEECFLSETTDVPKGQHACQLIVDEDAMTTEDFEITDQTRIVDVKIAEASLADGSTGNISSNESHELHSRETLINPNNPSTSRNTEQTLTEKGALYKELIQHQILHGDSLNELTDKGERFHSGRTRVNGLPDTARGSNDFQQFLQPSAIGDDQQQTPPVVNERDDGDNSDGDHPEAAELTPEERDSSASVRDRAESSCSLSSHDELEARPVLMGSNGQTNDEELQVDGNSARDRSPILGSEHHENVPDAQDHEVIPDHHDDDEEDPHTHEEVTDHHGNEVSDVENYEETSDIPDHEVTPEPDIHEDTPNVDDRIPTPDEHAPVPTINQPTSLQDIRVEHRHNTPSVPELRDFESVQNNDRPLQQRERPTGDVTSGFQSTRASSAPSLSSRELVGGNEETRRYNRRVQVDDFLLGDEVNPIPSAPPVSEFMRNSAGQTERMQARVSDAYGGFDRGGKHSLPDQPQRNMLRRRSPPGALFGDQDIRRPPLYTSAPTRPYSSLPYTRDYSVISPLVSPRSDERSAPSATRAGPNGEAFHDSGRIPRSTPSPSTAFQGLQDRQTPMGSVHTADLSPPVSSSSQPTSTELWSEDRVKELLDSLKQPQKRKNGHSPDTLVSPRDRSESSETTVLKTHLAGREEYIKKLKARNAIYEKELVKLRAKEMELAKALSLAETSQAAAKEQEDIVSQLTHALGEKEMEYSELERKVNDMKRTQSLLQSEMESSKRVHEIRVKELRSNNHSLADEVKTLRQDSLQPSPDYVNKYKKLVDAFSESRGVNASLQDQVKLLEKDNLDLRGKLGKVSSEIELLKAGNISSFARADYATTNEGMLERRYEYNSRSTAVNGYLGTSESTKFIARHQSDGEAKIKQKSRAIRGNHLAWDSRNGEDRETGYKSRIPGDDHQVSVERPDGNTSSSSFNRFALESESPTRDAILSGRRRKAFADDGVSSDVSDIDVSRYLHTRSYSSDSITSPTLLQNRLSEGFRNSGKVNGRERSSQDVGLDYRKKDKKRRERPHSYHSGSYENLSSSISPPSRTPSTPTPQATNFAVRGHHVDFSPTSPESSDIAPLSYDRSSPRRGKPFAPNSPREIDLGMDVLVTRACGKIGRGKVKFIGYLPTRSDTVYLGLELDNEGGKHDGQFQGQRYFKCKANRGIFVPFSKVVMAYA